MCLSRGRHVACTSGCMSIEKVLLVSPARLTRNIQERRREAAPAAVDVPGLEAELRKNVEGEVRFDEGTKGLYAEDASNYRHIPVGVVVPRSKQDVVEAIAACRRFGAPVTQIKDKESRVELEGPAGVRIVAGLFGGLEPTSPVASIRLEGPGPRPPPPKDLF